MDRQLYKGLKHVGTGKAFRELCQDLTTIAVTLQQGEIFRTRPDHPLAHPASCTVGTGSFPGVKGRDAALAIHRI
jgi:hypothetical protein